MSNDRVSLMNSVVVVIMIKLLIVLNIIGFVYNKNNSVDSVIIFDILMASLFYHLALLAVAYINFDHLSAKKVSLLSTRYSMFLLVFQIMAMVSVIITFMIVGMWSYCIFDMCSLILSACFGLTVYYGIMILLMTFIIHDIRKIQHRTPTFAISTPQDPDETSSINNTYTMNLTYLPFAI